MVLKRPMVAFLTQLLLAIRSRFTRRARLEAENLILCQQLAVLRLLILRHARRRLVSIGVTNNPTAEWIAGQVTDAFPWDEAPRHLIRDRDGAYGPAYTRRIRAMGIRDRPTAPRSPWQNGHVERLIGSIRRESLDHLVVFGEAHLRDVLKAYASYYNQVRPHLSLDKDAPDFRGPQKIGRIAAIPILGGLHHQYVRL